MRERHRIPGASCDHPLRGRSDACVLDELMSTYGHLNEACRRLVLRDSWTSRWTAEWHINDLVPPYRQRVATGPRNEPPTARGRRRAAAATRKQEVSGWPRRASLRVRCCHSPSSVSTLGQRSAELGQADRWVVGLSLFDVATEATPKVGLAQSDHTRTVRGFTWTTKPRHRPGLEDLVSTGRKHGFESH